MAKLASAVNWIVGCRYLTLVLRLILGGLFLLAAVGKLPQQAKFVDVVTDYGLLPLSWAEAYGFVLPWLELAVGSLLILGLFTKLAAATIILLAASFIAANGTGVYSECYCFGPLWIVKTSDALVIDVFLIAAALQVLFHRGELWSVDSLLAKRRGRT